MKSQWFIMAVLFPIITFSQGNSSRLNLHTIGSVGMAAGESTVKPLFQVTSGVFCKKWFGGIGAGMDNYNLKSLPLFAEGRIHFERSLAAYLYADAGYNFPVGNEKPREMFKISHEYKGGLYLDAGIGYRIKLSPLHHLSFSAGYSRKNIREKKVFYYPCGVNPCYMAHYNVYVFDYSFGRVTAKLSWEIGK